MSQPGTPQFRYALLLREIQNFLDGAGVDSVGLLLIRLDGLKEVNAAFGYLGGDHVLEEFARRVERVARRDDRSLAVNGTTFALLIANPHHAGHVRLAAERVAKEAQEPVPLDAARARVRAHMGFALAPEQARTSEELLRRAELALQAARRRDEAYRAFGPELDQCRPGAALPSAFDVDEALKLGQFELHYQPKVALRSGRLIGAEGLLRWRGPEGELLGPADFIPAIEHTHSIRAVLWFALNAALRNACEWREVSSGLSVAVNVSPRNLSDPDLVDLVAEALGVWGLPAERLVLEITETALLDDPQASTGILRRLRELGVGLAIDDFGTGYSSLSYLRAIPAQELKIDRSFISTLQNSHRDRQIVASVIQLGHAVDMKVVAEGIETMEAMQTLVSMYCDIGQGYYFSESLPAEEFRTQWIELFARRATGAGLA